MSDSREEKFPSGIFALYSMIHTSCLTLLYSYRDHIFPFTNYARTSLERIWNAFFTQTTLMRTDLDVLFCII
jgi:hypothetical protein